jgi:hypothetical protein
MSGKSVEYARGRKKDQLELIMFLLIKEQDMD